MWPGSRSRLCRGSVRAAGGSAGAGGRVLSPAGDPAVLRADGERAADGAGRSQLLDDRRGGRAPRAAPAAALPVPLSRPSRAPAWTPGRSSAGSPGTAGPRSACSPTFTSRSPSPGNASKTPAQTWTPGSSRSPSRNCCGSCATRSSRRPDEIAPIGCTGRPGDVGTSTAPAKPTNAGTPTPR
jgi:hypothetical protein